MEQFDFANVDILIPLLCFQGQDFGSSGFSEFV